jgi:N-acetyl-anhydromuramyl-L-alanine amidase AmpD
MSKEKPARRTPARKPLVQYDGRHLVDSHGLHKPQRGIWHTTESHDWAGVRDLRGIAEFWHRQDRGYGAHNGIDKHGNSAVYVDPHLVAWHCGGRNTNSIGVELIGFARFTPSVWWLRLGQLNKLAKWIAYYNVEYGIPIRFDTENGWSGHRDQANQTHWDPGRFFPKNYVIRKAKEFRAKGWQ